MTSERCKTDTLNLVPRALLRPSFNSRRGLLTTWFCYTNREIENTERIFSKAEGLISPYLGPPEADREELSYFNCCTSLSHGAEIFCSTKK